MTARRDTRWSVELRAPMTVDERKTLVAVTENWSAEPEVACRAGRIRDGIGGTLYALEREGLVVSRCSHNRRRQWRLTERGVVERRDIEAKAASATKE